jgi:uncharacterized surface protein with fasciclin (FAS1) repeats
LYLDVFGLQMKVMRIINKDMNHFLRQVAFKGIWSLLILSAILMGCEKEIDRYYNEGPGDIGPPIITYLQEDETFSKFNELVKKSGIASLLEKGAVYTMLAPTNEAIDQYNLNHPEQQTSAMDSAALVDFVNYHILFGIYYQYDFDKRYLRQLGNRYASRMYDAETYQNKSLAVYPPSFFGAMGGIDYTDDYESIYNVPSSKSENTFCVEGAMVLKEKMDIDCSNGVFHGVNNVLVPLPNTYEYLAGNNDFSLYHEFIERFDTLIYDPDNSQVIDGVEQKAYKKEFWYTDKQGNRQSMGFNYADEGSDLTIFAPSNDVLNDFFEPYLSNFGGSYSNIPSYIIVELMKHNVASVSNQSRLFPTAMIGGIRLKDNKTVFNIEDYMETPGVPTSNGLIYPVKTILNPPLLSRITGRFLLDPDFSSMLYLMEETGRLSSIADAEYTSNEFLFGERVKLPKSWTIIAPSSTVFSDSLSVGIEEWSTSQMRRLADFLIIPDTVYITNPGDAVFDKGVNIKPFNSGYYKTNSKTFLRKSGNTLYSSLYPDSTATIIDEIYGTNGVIYVVDDMLYNVASSYTVFSVLLNNVSNATDIFLELTNGQHSELINELRISSKDYTLFIPTDQAMNTYNNLAVNIEGMKTWSEMNSDEREYFMRNHIVRKRFIIEAYKDMTHYSSVGDPLSFVTESGQLRIQGSQGGVPKAKVVSVNMQASNGVVNFIDQVIIPDFTKMN